MTGEELKAFRLEADMTRKELAEFIGVERGHLARWERGQVPIPTYAWRICSQYAQLQHAQKTNWALAVRGEERDEDRMVRDFHRASGTLPVRAAPEVPPDDEVRFRARLDAEEFVERLEATFDDPEIISSLREQLRLFISSAPVAVDLAELADAWADLKYVIIGGEATFGIDGNAVFRVVHAANMRKFGPGGSIREDGKILKPPDWQPPDIAAELDRQKSGG